MNAYLCWIETETQPKTDEVLLELRTTMTMKMIQLVVALGLRIMVVETMNVSVLLNAALQPVRVVRVEVLVLSYYS